MESKDKMIGTILVIVGLFFIGLGVFVNMNTKNAKTTSIVYQEQIQDDTSNNEDKDNNIDVYSEPNTEDSGDTTRYVY